VRTEGVSESVKSVKKKRNVTVKKKIESNYDAADERNDFKI